MTAAAVRLERDETLGEEIANSVSHGVGLIAALVAIPFLVAEALRRGSLSAVVGVGVFSASMVFLYLSSTLYHALPPNRAKRVFRILDHAGIFVLIAGTYTPFTLGPLRGAWGWTLLAIVWTLAVAGVVFTSLGGLRHKAFSTALYLAMGWLVVVAVRPMLQHVPLGGLLWLAAGGLAYTAGAAFYAAKRLRYAHFVFHLLVLAGTTCHAVAVLRYAI